MRDLSIHAWHTGGRVTPLDPGERCPVLFRDLGPAPTLALLEGRLARLVGMHSPVTYLRDATYREPYADGVPVGRVVVLDARRFGVWRAEGGVYVAPADAPVDVAYLPGGLEPAAWAERLVDARTAADVREIAGGSAFDALVTHARQELVTHLADLAATERAAGPLRRRLQSMQLAERRAARAEMAARGLSESDLCTAWHHLPAEERDRVRAALGVAR